VDICDFVEIVCPGGNAVTFCERSVALSCDTHIIHCLHSLGMFVGGPGGVTDAIRDCALGAPDCGVLWGGSTGECFGP
jgi:hypothetical protein